MRISVEWANDEHTILRWIFTSGWTWDDYAAAIDESNRLLATIDHTADVIGDLRNSANLPANALTMYKRFVGLTASNVGLIVLVGASRFVKAMVSLFLRIMPGKTPGTDFVFAGSMDRAYVLIAQNQAKRESENR